MSFSALKKQAEGPRSDPPWRPGRDWDRDQDRSQRGDGPGSYRDRDQDRDRDRRPNYSHQSSRYNDDYRNHSNDRGYAQDGYRLERDSWAPRTDSYPPPPPREPPPPPPPLDSPRPPQGDFTIRFDKPVGIEDSYDSYRPNRDRRHDPSRSRASRDGVRQGRHPQRPHRYANGGYRPIRLAANRPMLQGLHSTGPELAFYDVGGGVTYRPVDDLSDSDEADMDISDEEGAADSGEPSTKRTRLTADRTVSDNEAPKWSNPDPYTALPPPDTTGHKKKDVVQLIRKARVQAKETKSSIPAEAEEFISCDFDSDAEDGETHSSGEESPGVSGAPTRPRAMARQTPRDDGQSDKPGSSRRAEERRRDTANFQSSSREWEDSGRQTARNRPAEDVGTSALGSRKRTHDDRVIFPAHARLKKASKMPVGGDLLLDWAVSKGEEPCPWIVADHSGSATLGVWLHKEVVDLYEHLRPRDYEDHMRNQLVQELKALCRATYKDAEVYPFGSFPSGLYLPTGDMDLVFCSDSYMRGGRAKYTTKSTLFKFRNFLQNKQLPYLNEVEVIIHAKVPLVKYVDKRTALKVDISFENLTGVKAINTFMAWKEQYPAMPVLATVIKHFLAMRGLNEPVNGGIGGFSITCLIVSMLQMLPAVQSRNMDPSHHLGDLLLEFFDLYGNRFNWKDVAISVNPPKYIPKNEVRTFAYKNQDRLSIIDPNNPENDIAGGSANTPTIMACFAEAHKLLTKRMQELAALSDSEKRNASILEVVFAGNYSTFRTQRTHLYKLFRESFSFENRANGHSTGVSW
ncbi:hypothetical protein VTK73DRAFT_3532 [Phialemonium thermophilum]|uniref:polynucleotide adenylyltransferase n=1 Tax=Phialemonium thermophilum TaxID=223376 RepID=A0ABR3XZL1_9PEZI